MVRVSIISSWCIVSHQVYGEYWIKNKIDLINPPQEKNPKKKQKGGETKSTTTI